MTRYQLFALSQMWIPMLAAAAISFVYFLAAEAESLGRRIFAAAHGLLVVSAALYAIAVGPWSEGWWTGYSVPFLAVFAVAGISLVYSLLQFSGWRAAIHALQLLLLPSAVWIWFIGTMTITHDWL